MKAQTFIFSVLAGLTTLAVWEVLKPKVTQQQPEQTQTGFDFWPFN
jgi:membrane protein implicated in regulation of membrane protease activity